MELPPRQLVPNELHISRYKQFGPASPFHYAIYFNIYIYIIRYVEIITRKTSILLYIISLKIFFKNVIIKYYSFLLKRTFFRHIKLFKRRKRYAQKKYDLNTLENSFKAVKKYLYTNRVYKQKKFAKKKKRWTRGFYKNLFHCQPHKGLNFINSKIIIFRKFLIIVKQSEPQTLPRLRFFVIKRLFNQFIKKIKVTKNNRFYQLQIVINLYKKKYIKTSKIFELIYTQNNIERNKTIVIQKTAYLSNELFLLKANKKRYLSKISNKKSSRQYFFSNILKRKNSRYKQSVFLSRKDLSFFYVYYLRLLWHKLFQFSFSVLNKNLLSIGVYSNKPKYLYKKIRFLKNKFALFNLLVLSEIILSQANIFFVLNYIGWNLRRKTFHTGFLKYFFIILRLMFYLSGKIYGIRAVLTGPYNRHSRTKALIWRVGHALKNNTTLKKTIYDMAVYDLQYGSVGFHLWVDYELLVV
jgi:hypothetical protein